MKKCSSLILVFVFALSFITLQDAEAKRFGGFGFSKRSFSKPYRKPNPFLQTKRTTPRPAIRPSSQRSVQNYTAKTNRFKGTSKSSTPKPGKTQKLYHKDRVKKAAARNPNYGKESYHDRWNQQYGNFSPPGAAFAGSSSFGGFSSMFMWMMLMNSMNGGFFYHNQNEPGVQEFRAEAEELAKTDPEIREKLDQLDSKIKTAKEQEITQQPGYIPSNVDPDLIYSKEYVDENPEMFYSDAAKVEEANPLGTLVVAFLLLGGVYLFVLGRKRAPTPSS